jgi:broad specificity phosphatase PhoE
MGRYGVQKLELLCLPGDRQSTTLHCQVMMTRALLLRHGETEWNLTGRLQGRSDVALTHLGIRQVQEALQRLPPFRHVVSSPLRRAFDTAVYIANANQVSPSVDPRLIERSWGAWEGLTPEEVELESPGAFERGELPEDYEERGSVLGRVGPLLDEVLSNPAYDGTILVTHGGLMLDVVLHLGGEPTRFKNLEGQWVVKTHGSVQLDERVEFVPSAKRLER